MLLWIVITVLASLVGVNYLLERSVLYPPFLFCAIWLLVLLTYAANLIEVDQLHSTVLVVVGVGAFLFSLGGCVAWLFPSALIATKIRVGPRLVAPTQKWFQYALVAFGVIGMLIVLKGTFAAAASGSGATLLARARSGTSDGSVLGTYIPELTIFGAVLLSLERRDWIFWMMATSAFLTAVFTTSRGPILQLFCGLVTVSMIQRRRTSFVAALRYVRIPVLCFLALFITLVFTTKNLSEVAGGVGFIALFSVVTYVVGPLAALDYVFENPSLYIGQPNHTLKLPLQLLAKAHLIVYTPPPLLDEFVAVPFPANVYTGYKFFYTDYGFWGAGLAILFVGFAHTLLYRKAITNSQMALYCFGMSLLPLVMFFFDDLYSALGVNLTVFLFGCIYFGMRHISIMGPMTSPQKAIA